jgi:hypothetical protein
MPNEPMPQKLPASTPYAQAMDAMLRLNKQPPNPNRLTEAMPKEFSGQSAIDALKQYNPLQR